MTQARAGSASEPCWCTREHFSAQLLQQVPESQRDKACICQACVKAWPSVS
ncbi:MAG: cysteine-rich CWC family protein [Limnohabitans sp.]